MLPCKADLSKLGVDDVVVVSAMTLTICAVINEGDRSRLSDELFVVTGWLCSLPSGETPRLLEGDIAGDVTTDGDATRFCGLPLDIFSWERMLLCCWPCSVPCLFFFMTPDCCWPLVISAELCRSLGCFKMAATVFEEELLPDNVR